MGGRREGLPDKIYPKDWQNSSRVFVIHLIERMRDNQNIQVVKGGVVGKAVELRCFWVQMCETLSKATEML